MAPEELILQSITRVEETINRVDDRLRADVRHLQDELKNVHKELAVLQQRMDGSDSGQKVLASKVDSVEKTNLATEAKNSTLLSILLKVIPILAALAFGAGVKPVATKLFQETADVAPQSP